MTTFSGIWNSSSDRRFGGGRSPSSWITTGMASGSVAVRSCPSDAMRRAICWSMRARRSRHPDSGPVRSHSFSSTSSNRKRSIPIAPATSPALYASSASSRLRPNRTRSRTLFKQHSSLEFKRSSTLAGLSMVAACVEVPPTSAQTPTKVAPFSAATSEKPVASTCTTVCSPGNTVSSPLVGISSPSAVNILASKGQTSQSIAKEPTPFWPCQMSKKAPFGSLM
mmetsp:Transcript_42744/g.87365  ORF Transcript_42744/g.87365 Transcript_42744/m.87365 type:complete len:224 (-) Transcript_42744:726-1397(-)